MSLTRQADIKMNQKVWNEENIVLRKILRRRGKQGGLMKTVNPLFVLQALMGLQTSISIGKTKKSKYYKN